MAAMKYFVVTQTRKVMIRAGDIVTAIDLADSAFKGEDPDPTQGSVADGIQITNITASPGH